MDPKDDMLVAAHPASRDFAPPMTEKNNVAPDGLVPTPTECAQPRRFSDFATVGEALDYAAQVSRALNFPYPPGRLVRAYIHRDLRAHALLDSSPLIAPRRHPA